MTAQIEQTTPETRGRERISWLHVPPPEEVPAAIQALYARSLEKRGVIHNFYQALALRPAHLEALVGYVNALFDPAQPTLSRREREFIAVVVSAENRCEFCIASHGALLRKITGDPDWVDTVSINYRRATLTVRERALADLAIRITRDAYALEEADLAPLRAAGLEDEAILDAVEIAALFNLTNRLTNAIGIRPNPEYFTAHRLPGR
jgi:uncharacterized peroxidase-related enzyme